MEIEDKVAIKAFVFGGAFPLIALPLQAAFNGVLAWGVAAFIWTAMFHWLPPRIHRNLTVIRSAMLCLAAAILGVLLAAGVRALFG